MEINKDTSYLIGLFQSDGHMSKGKGNKGRAQIEISSKDEDIIHKIKEIIPYNYGIRKRVRNIVMKEKNYLHESININICNMEFRKFLEDNGVSYGKKSKIIDVPKSENLSKLDYIRGLFDGDGSLGFTKTGFPFIGFVTESENIKDYYYFFQKLQINQSKKIIEIKETTYLIF
jgi:DNA-binding transcriptional regulator WhiA